MRLLVLQAVFSGGLEALCVTEESWRGFYPHWGAGSQAAAAGSPGRTGWIAGDPTEPGTGRGFSSLSAPFALCWSPDQPVVRCGRVSSHLCGNSWFPGKLVLTGA